MLSILSPVDAILGVYYAANAAATKYVMESAFYNKASGKLNKGTHRSYGETRHPKRDPSSVYSIEDNEQDATQYPMGVLSSHQQGYIESFLKGITSDDSIAVDPYTRGIHWLGIWKSQTADMTVSCTVSQPHVTNATVHLNSITEASIHKHVASHFDTGEFGGPSISRPKMNPQVQGKYAVPLVDSLLSCKLVSQSNIQWSMVVLSNSQPIFNIVYGGKTYECILTHGSCNLLAKHTSVCASISSPRSTSQNFSFRSNIITDGAGTGPSLTVHTSGVIQYQGKPQSIYPVASSFKSCINMIMTSEYSHKFVTSLGIVREFG